MPKITNKAELSFDYNEAGSARIGIEIVKGSDECTITLSTTDKEGKTNSTNISMDAKEVTSLVYALQGIVLFMGESRRDIFD